jgi:hypothetical protein
MRPRHVTIAAALAIGAAIHAAGETRPTEPEPKRLQIVPASDSVTFAACKKAGGFIDYDDADLDGPLPPYPAVCEWRPDATS